MLGGDVTSHSARRIDDADLADILELSEGMSAEDLDSMLSALPPHIVNAFWDFLSKGSGNDESRTAPATPLLQAEELDPKYKRRDHLEYLSDVLAKAVTDVENGKNRFIAVSMPPRMGKSDLGSTKFPTWVLRKHPDWKIGLISHSPSLAVLWGRTVRDLVVSFSSVLGVSLTKDSKAVQEWYTTSKGSVISRSIRESITGLGFKVLIIDDAVKDFADAHSLTQREYLWDWWKSNAYTRLEEPYLVVVIGTRWHEDDIIGRLLSAEYEGSPEDWEVVKFPAIAEADDVLGREPGDPLYSPILEETREEALARWDRLRRTVGTYTWSALYQQAPSPSKGAIFDTDWWRFWTKNEALASRDDDGNLDPNGRVVYLDPDSHLRTARWLDSWDMAFKATSDSDYVVGQRWAQLGALKYLLFQQRARLTFTATLARVLDWADPNGSTPWARYVHERVVEDKANGTAIIDMLKEKVSGIVPENPSESKEARARAVTPDWEAGNIIIPLPSDPGNEWVVDLLSEFREFPTGVHDDQVDAGTQAIKKMRTPQAGSVNTPSGRTVNSRRGRVAQTQRRITRAGGRG